MAVQPPVHSRLTDRVTFLAVPTVAVIVLLAGATGLTPPAVALAIGVGGAGLWACSHLVRAALDIHHAEGTFVACKGAGFIGLASLAAALTATVPLWGPPAAGVWATCGYAVTVALFAIGVLFLPGQATSWTVRTRRAFDGAGLADAEQGLSSHRAIVPPLLGGSDPAALSTGDDLRVHPDRARP